METAPIRILIVEDEFITQETLRSVLLEMGYAISGCVMTAKAALEILEKGETDFAILDIHIKGDKDGVWLADQVRKQFQIPFIFLTAFGDQSTVKRAIEQEPYGYLVKPFNKMDIYTAIEVALKNFAKQQTISDPDSPPTEEAPEHILTQDCIFIRDSYMFVKLRIEDIIYIKSDKNYLEVHLRKNRRLVRGKLSQFLQRLPENRFMQIHRSYAINVKEIESFGGGYVEVAGQELPLGNQYRDELKRRINVF